MGSRDTSAESGRIGRTGDDEQSIPLYCALCPERESFSDVSHLLTHVSSKSHLSRKFDVEIRAKSNDRAATSRLAEYEAWYQENRIDDHLRRRMESKQRRRPNRRERISNTASRPARPSRSSRIPPISRTPSIKVEPGENSANAFDPSTQHHRNTSNNGANFGQPATASHGPSRGRNVSSMYQTPTLRCARVFNNQEYAEVGKFEREGSDGTSFDGTLSVDTAELDDDDTVKLKGVQYPGMAGFDAATPEQRRKRNQKKDDSVVQTMRESSEAIEAVECIWSGVGNFDRRRDIYASPSIDGSPISKKTETQAKKKRKQQQKEASPVPSTRGRPRMMTRGAARAQRQAAARQASAATILKEDSDDAVDDDSWTVDQRSQESGDVFRDGNQRVLNRMTSPLQENRLHLHHRPALQQLDSNGMMAPPIQPFKQNSYPFFPQPNYARDARSAISQPEYSPSYMLNPAGADGNSFNPLCFQRGGVTPTAFPQFLDSQPAAAFEGDERTSTPGFQPINPRYGFHGMHSHDPNSEF